MHPMIASGLAAELDRLADTVKRNWAWPSPAAGFTSWLFRRHGTPTFFTPPAADLAAVPPGRLREAPVLAAYGYTFASDDDPDPALAEAWAAGARHLAGRDPEHRLTNPTALENDLTDLHGPMPTVVVVAPLG